MEVTINYNGQAVSVEVTVEVYKYLDRADHKEENLSHERRRHWDEREFDEYIAFALSERDGGLHPPNLLPAVQNEIPASGYSVPCSLKYSAERS